MYKMPKKSNEMINFYERVPKHMLLDAPNPNYDDHLYDAAQQTYEASRGTYDTLLKIRLQSNTHDAV